MANGVDVAAELTVDGDPEAVLRARRLIAETLGPTRWAQLVDDAVLVVSELVTNALLHGNSPVVVRVTVAREQVRVEVDDGSPTMPVRPLSSTEGLTGRGLALIEAVAARWGARPTSAGKTVWAEITASGIPDAVIGAPGAAGSTAGDAATAADPADLLASWPDWETAVRTGRYTVRLGDVPTDLLLAAKSHVDNLVREFALASRGAQSGATAAVPAHLARLIETVTNRFAEARQSIKRQALAAAAAGVERTELELTLPVEAADAGEEYLAALDEADGYAKAARLLTLETPPQHQAFRRWYVTSLVRQLRAVARGQAPPPVQSFQHYLLDMLGTVTAARRAAEQTARLQSVTSALAQAITPEDVAAVVVSEGVSALGASGGSLLLPRGDGHLAVPGTVGYSAAVVEQLRSERLDAALPGAEAMRTGRAVWLESRQERDARFPELVGMEPSTISICAVPVVVGEQTLGVLRFSFDSPRLFDDDERRFVHALAAQTAAALERARLFTDERRARARITFLADATSLLTSSLEPVQTVRHLMSLFVPAFADWAAVFVVDDDGSGPTAFAHRDPDITRRLEPAFVAAPLDMTVGGGVAEAIRTATTIRYASVPEAVRDRVAARAADGADPSDYVPESLLCVPLLVRGAVTGAVVLARTAGQPYDDEEQRIVEDVAARAAVAVDNARQYARERETAVTLQRSLLPQRVPEIAGVAVAWRYLPAGAGSLVGGDWYDVLPLDDGRVALVIGDVMGRGVHAAAVMGQLRATARAHAAAHLAPSEVLARLDAAVGRLEQGQITTVAFAILDPVGCRLTVASAGHLPPLLVPSDGEPCFVAVDPGPPLGAGAPDYPEVTLPVERGGTVLLYTDGLVEDRTRPVDAGMEALRLAAAGITSAEALCDRALSALGRGNGHDDDTALLAVTLRAR